MGESRAKWYGQGSRGRWGDWVGGLVCGVYCGVIGAFVSWGGRSGERLTEPHRKAGKKVSRGLNGSESTFGYFFGFS